MGRPAKYPFRTIAVGESFFVDGTANIQNVRQYAYFYKQKLRRIFSVAVEASGCRVTRTF